MIDEEIEKAVLYYMIFENEELDVTDIDFTNLLNKKIIKAINNLKKNKEEVSVLTIRNKIDSANNKILEYISNLGEYVYTTGVDTAYKILKDNTKKRELFSLSKEILKETNGIKDIDIYIEEVISKLQKIEFQTERDETFAELVSKTAKRIEENINKKRDYSFYTGFFDLDALTDGLHEGELTIIGARPRCWKDYFFFTDSR